MGRKKTLITRDEFISYRVSALEKKVIELSSNEVGLSISEFSRRAAMNMTVKRRFTDKELEIYSDLHKYHSNFTHISNLIKSSDTKEKASLTTKIIEVQELIKEHLNQFKK